MARLGARSGPSRTWLEKGRSELLPDLELPVFREFFRIMARAYTEAAAEVKFQVFEGRFGVFRRQG